MLPYALSVWWCRAAVVAATALFVFAPGLAAAVAIEDYPDLDTLTQTLVKEHGFKRATLRRIFANVTLRPDIVAALDRPRETLPWYEYRRTFVNEERIRLGVRYWMQYKKPLARAKERYGVPCELIVAIIGIETRYGANRGDYPALDALLTLTLLYPRRADYFRQELISFLLLARELKLDPRKIKSSYAGALGIPQFMPRSYREYAVDFDNDRRRDLLKDGADAIGSIANFLYRHGWAAGEPIVDAADLAGTLYSWPMTLGVQPTLRVRDWFDHGVFAHRDILARENLGDADRPAALMTLEGESGPQYYLGYNNFYVITRYNRSQNYAMAVYELAQLIRQRYQERT
jgi:peptidoglycan lytic transglycosylase B